MTSSDFVAQLNPDQFSSVTVHCRTRFCANSITFAVMSENEIRAGLARAGWLPADHFRLAFSGGPPEAIYCPSCTEVPS